MHSASAILYSSIPDIGEVSHTQREPNKVQAVHIGALHAGNDGKYAIPTGSCCRKRPIFIHNHPGHIGVLQLRDCVVDPTQFAHPFAGAGLLHTRDCDGVPPPQLTLHADNPDHADHQPFIGVRQLFIVTPLGIGSLKLTHSFMVLVGISFGDDGDEVIFLHHSGVMISLLELTGVAHPLDGDCSAVDQFGKYSL